MSITALRGSVASSALLSRGAAEPWVLRSTRLNTGLALSNGGRTLTNVSGGDNYSPGAWTDKTLNPTSPPVYWEILIGTRGAGVNTGFVGIASVLREETYSDLTNSLANSTTLPSIGLREDGSIWVNGSSSLAANASRAYTAGDVIGVAFVPFTGEVWFSKNGTWIVNTEVIPGAGGLRKLLKAHGWKPFIHCRDQGDVATLRSTLAEFSHSVPSGFIPLAEAIGLTMDYIPIPLVNPEFQNSNLTGWTVYSGSFTITSSSTPGFTQPCIESSGASNFMGQDVLIPQSAIQAVDLGHATAFMSCVLEVQNSDSGSRVRFEPQFLSATDTVISSLEGPLFNYNVPITGPFVQRFIIPAGTRKIRYRFRYNRSGSFIRMDNFALGLSILPKLQVYLGHVHAVLGKPKNVVGVRHATLHAIIVP